MMELIRRNKDLEQENRMLKRIITNLKRQLKLSKITNRHNKRWSKEEKLKIIWLRDKLQKSFPEIANILKLSNRDCRRLYGSAK